MSERLVTKVRGAPGAPVEDAPPALLDPAGARVVLGGADPFVSSVAPTPTSLYGPRGLCLLEPEGPLWVADTGHHRLLGYRTLPEADGAAADWVLGQPDFASEGRNRNQAASAHTLNVPTGVARFGERGLVVADGWNNRVLIWFEAPTESGVPADVVLGQADFTGEMPNRGAMNVAGPDTMHWPFAVLVHEGRLYVADTGNRRVLVWRELPGPGDHGRPADIALGQPDLESRSDNGGRMEGAAAATMRWPHDLAIAGGRPVVSDAGNNRLQIWSTPPSDHGVPADVILGQKSPGGVDHNQGAYWPDRYGLNMPYCTAATEDGWLLAGDTANSRIVAYPPGTPSAGAAAALAGQAHFRMKGDNRWVDTTRDSLCWPYGLQVVGHTALVADTGNHRVLIWDLAADLAAAVAYPGDRGAERVGEPR